MGTYVMSKKELDQVGVFEKLKMRDIKQKEAALVLGLSERQVRKKLHLYRALGPPSLIHGLRGRPSNNQLDPALMEAALSLVAEKYSDFGPTFAAEKLQEIHGVGVNHESLRKKMIRAGLWQPRKRKVKHREWRERRACLGELVQLDGSNHDWFEGRAPKCDLLAFIDDATSNLLYLEFAPESTRGVMSSTKKYLEKHGRPVGLYTDRGGVYRVNQNNPEHEKTTQYERALGELGIEPIHAGSPQAKGRVERLFGTLQDRLVKEMRLRGITTIKEANCFLENEYLPKHNPKYTVAPKSQANLHRSVENYDLSKILCIKKERILTNDFTLRYQNQWFQLDKDQRTLIFPKDKIMVMTQLTGEIQLMIRDTRIYFHLIDKPTVKEKMKPNIQASRKPWVPPVDHPWRNCNDYKKLKPAVSTLQKQEVSTLV